MAWFTDTSSAPNVPIGATNFRSKVFLEITDTSGATAFRSYTGILRTTVRELRGLDYSTATTSAAYWDTQPNTSAIVTRASEGGDYTLTITTDARSLSEDT